MSLRYCKVCGTPYDYCPSCGRDRNEPRYKISFDKEECKIIFDILASNGVSRLSSSDTYDALKDINYKDITISNKRIKEHIEKIEKENKKIQKKKEQFEDVPNSIDNNEIIENEDNIESVNDIIINSEENADNVDNPDYPMGDKVLYS